MRSFNYDEITASTQQSIEIFVKRAEEAESKGLRKMYLDQAYGVYYGWYQLTIGHQTDGDDTRLEQLIWPTQESTGKAA